MLVSIALTLAVISMPPQVPQATPIQRHTLTLPDGGGLRYAIAIPDGYDGSREVPLVLALHFGWGEALPPNYGAVFLEILVEPALRELGAIIVAPNCPARSWVDDHSEAAVLALLDHVRGEYRIDPDRLVVTGFSLGGMGTWYFASRHAEMFSAAIPMASVPMIAISSEPGSAVQRFTEAGSVEWPPAMLRLPTYVIHSRDDELISIGPVEAAAAELKALGADIELLAIDAGIGHHQTPRYVPYLTRTVAWIREVWAGRERGELR
jgi:predicted peptidase